MFSVHTRCLISSRSRLRYTLLLEFHTLPVSLSLLPTLPCTQEARSLHFFHLPHIHTSHILEVSLHHATFSLVFMIISHISAHHLPLSGISLILRWLGGYIAHSHFSFAEPPLYLHTNGCMISPVSHTLRLPLYFFGHLYFFDSWCLLALCTHYDDHPLRHQIYLQLAEHCTGWLGRGIHTTLTSLSHCTAISCITNLTLSFYRHHTDILCLSWVPFLISHVPLSPFLFYAVCTSGSLSHLPHFHAAHRATLLSLSRALCLTSSLSPLLLHGSPFGTHCRSLDSLPHSACTLSSAPSLTHAL